MAMSSSSDTPRRQPRGADRRIRPQEADGTTLSGAAKMRAMKRRDLVDLVLLAALWGASFLFTRMAVPAFGAFAIAELRVAVAALVLLPLLALRGDLSELRAAAGAFRAARRGEHRDSVRAVRLGGAVDHRRPGLDPECHGAAVHRTGRLGLAARATDLLQWLGMAIGFAGVLWLTGARAGFDGEAVVWAVARRTRCDVVLWPVGNVAKRYFSGVRPLAVAAGSQTAAALLLLPFAIATWPERRRRAATGPPRSRSACCAPGSRTSCTSG